MASPALKRLTWQAPLLLALLVLTACQPAPVPQPDASATPQEEGLPTPSPLAQATQSGEPSPSLTPAQLPNQPHGDSYSPAISADGRYVAFVSRSQDLAGGKLAECPNPGTQASSIPCAGIFLYDRQSTALSLVSVSSAGPSANGNSSSPKISANGRWVAFASLASNLDPAKAAEVWGVFIHDRQTGNTDLVSTNAIDPSLSADGRFVAFNQLGETPAVIVIDRQTGNQVVASGASNDVSGASFAPHLSSDGRWLAFWSWNGKLVERDVEVCGPSDALYSCGDVFLYNGATGEMKRVEVGLPYEAGMRVPEISLSADGRLAAYSGQLYDRLQGLTQPLCGRSDQACQEGRLSGDGQVVAYRLEANFYRFERSSKTAAQVDVDAQGLPSDAGTDFLVSSEGEAFEPGFDLSRDGRFMVFATTAGSLQDEDVSICSDGLFASHNCYDIYLYDAQTAALEWISRPPQ